MKIQYPESSSAPNNPLPNLNPKTLLVHEGIIVDRPFPIRIDWYEIESQHEFRDKCIKREKSDVLSNTTSRSTTELVGQSWSA